MDSNSNVLKCLNKWHEIQQTLFCDGHQFKQKTSSGKTGVEASVIKNKIEIVGLYVDQK